MEAIENIKAWLAQGKEASYAEGKALYDAYGRNPALKLYFGKGLAKDNPVAHFDKLVYELGKLSAGTVQIKGASAAVGLPSEPVGGGEQKQDVPDVSLAEQLRLKIESLGKQGSAVFVKRALESNKLADCETDAERAALVDVIQGYTVELAKLDSFKADNQEALAKLKVGEADVVLPTWPTDEQVGAEELSEESIAKLMVKLNADKTNLRARISKLKNPSLHKKLSEAEKEEEIAKLNAELVEVLKRIDCLQADDKE